MKLTQIYILQSVGRRISGCACRNISISASFLTSLLSEIEDAERNMACLHEKYAHR